METLIKSVLAILFFLCLLDMPYGYFQLVRFAAVGGFGFLGYLANSKAKQTEMIIYVGLTVLFQPFYKISLGREIWNAVDVIVGVGLIGSMFIKKVGK